MPRPSRLQAIGMARKLNQKIRFSWTPVWFNRMVWIGLGPMPMSYSRAMSQ